MKTFSLSLFSLSLLCSSAVFAVEWNEYPSQFPTAPSAGWVYVGDVGAASNGSTALLEGQQNYSGQKVYFYSGLDPSQRQIANLDSVMNNPGYVKVFADCGASVTGNTTADLQNPVTYSIYNFSSKKDFQFTLAPGPFHCMTDTNNQKVLVQKHDSSRDSKWSQVTIDPTSGQIISTVTFTKKAPDLDPNSFGFAKWFSSPNLFVTTLGGEASGDSISIYQPNSTVSVGNAFFPGQNLYASFDFHWDGTDDASIKSTINLFKFGSTTPVKSLDTPSGLELYQGPNYGSYLFSIDRKDIDTTQTLGNYAETIRIFNAYTQDWVPNYADVHIGTLPVFGERSASIVVEPYDFGPQRIFVVDRSTTDSTSPPRPALPSVLIDPATGKVIARYKSPLNNPVYLASINAFVLFYANANNLEVQLVDAQTGAVLQDQSYIYGNNYPISDILDAYETSFEVKAEEWKPATSWRFRSSGQNLHFTADTAELFLFKTATGYRFNMLERAEVYADDVYLRYCESFLTGACADQSKKYILWNSQTDTLQDSLDLTYYGDGTGPTLSDDGSCDASNPRYYMGMTTINGVKKLLGQKCEAHDNVNEMVLQVQK